MRNILALCLLLSLFACDKTEMEQMAPMPDPGTMPMDTMPMDTMPGMPVDTMPGMPVDTMPGSGMDTTRRDTMDILLRRGSFQPQNNYTAIGTASLIRRPDSSHVLMLGEDFRTSFATGAVTMYLSKAQRLNLSDNSSFIRLAVINRNGAHNLEVEGTLTDEFNHVIIWCAPVRIPFGFAVLEAI